jgi:hypothetical protein
MWQETIGDCRYDDGSHSNYNTLAGQPDKEACLEICEHDQRCHAVDMGNPFTSTCWLFENSDGSHTGDGNAASRCYILEWSETVEDCRYLDGQHSNYLTLSNQPSVDACKTTCEDDLRCHAFDMGYPFVGTCWLFENIDDGVHLGNGVSSSRCYIHVTEADCPAGSTSRSVAVVSECSGATIKLQETIGDCRYDDGSHSNYDTLMDRSDKEACLSHCVTDSRYHVVDMNYPFTSTCWLFENSDGSHTGDGNAASRCYIVEWSETVGDCRYPDGQHSNYLTLSNQPSVDACKTACENDLRCHAFDMGYPFVGTCWLFENLGAGEHKGNGVSSSRCYIHVTHAKCDDRPTIHTPPALGGRFDGAADFTNSLNGHISVFGSEMQHLLPTKDMTVEMWVRWTHGGTDWAGPVSASQDDGSTERGWIL